jgi:hypothetical protein
MWGISLLTSKMATCGALLSSWYRDTEEMSALPALD